MHRLVIFLIPMFYTDTHQADHYGDNRINSKFDDIVKILSFTFPDA